MTLSSDATDRNDRHIAPPQVARAVEAAEVLFDAKDSSAVDIYEPRNSLEANAAVRRLGQSFEELPGTIARVLEAASGSADLLSGDRLQGPRRSSAERGRCGSLAGPAAPHPDRPAGDP